MDFPDRFQIAKITIFWFFFSKSVQRLLKNVTFSEISQIVILMGTIKMFPSQSSRKKKIFPLILKTCVNSPALSYLLKFPTKKGAFTKSPYSNKANDNMSSVCMDFISANKLPI